jgi:hypothetical protein
MAHVYVLGGVKPWVKTAAQEVGDKFDISTIYGIGARTGVSDHPKGLATDFMVYKDRAKGDAVAAYCLANWNRLAFTYIIWQQAINEGSGWEPMEDRGSPTANHEDHVHASYTATGAGEGAASGGGMPGTASGSADASGGYASALATLTSSATWTRVLLFVAGALLLAVTLYPFISKASGGIV